MKDYLNPQNIFNTPRPPKSKLNEGETGQIDQHLFDSENPHPKDSPNSIEESLNLAVIEPKYFCGPMKVKIPKPLMEYLLEFTDQELNSDRQPDATVVARAFKGKGSFSLTDKISNEFKEFLLECAEKYKQLLELDHRVYQESDLRKPKVDGIWMVSQGSEDYEPAALALWHFIRGDLSKSSRTNQKRLLRVG